MAAPERVTDPGTAVELGHGGRSPGVSDAQPPHRGRNRVGVARETLRWLSKPQVGPQGGGVGGERRIVDGDPGARPVNTRSQGTTGSWLPTVRRNPGPGSGPGEDRR